MTHDQREAQHAVEGIILRRIYERRIEGYTIETSKEIVAALSTPPAAVESNASVEARPLSAFEVLRDHYGMKPAVGDDAKKSEGGVEGHAGRPWPSPKPDAANDEAMASLDRSSPVAGIKPGPSDPTAERREIVVRWPAGCIDPNSCERNRYCMYVGCEHHGTDIKAGILAALDGGKP